MLKVGRPWPGLPPPRTRRPSLRSRADQPLLDLGLAPGYWVGSQVWEPFSTDVQQRRASEGVRCINLTWCLAPPSHTVPRRHPRSHRGGQGFKSPQLHAKLQVAALFRGYFRLPILAPFLHWERTGADLVQPTSLTSGDVPLFVRRVGAVAS